MKIVVYFVYSVILMECWGSCRVLIKRTDTGAKSNEKIHITNDIHISYTSTTRLLRFSAMMLHSIAIIPYRYTVQSTIHIVVNVSISYQDDKQ